MAIVQQRRPLFGGRRVYTDDAVVNDGAAPAAAGYGLLSLLTSLVWLAFGIIFVLLAFRFILALGGANPANGFANFIYTASHPFVSPFFGLFHYNFHLGISTVELYTLFAILVYGVVAWIITYALSLGRNY